jgi:nucleotide-binding universal stress UspA family protein
MLSLARSTCGRFIFDKVEYGLENMKCAPTQCSIKRILVAVDGSENSLRAVDKAIEMALSFGASVVLINVIGPSDSKYYSGKGKELNCEEKEGGSSKLCEAVQRMQVSRVLYDTKVVSGNPAEAILQEAEGEKEEDRYDLIIMGSKGDSEGQRFLFGSVSQKVTQYSRVAVLVVP